MVVLWGLQGMINDLGERSITQLEKTFTDEVDHLKSKKQQLLPD